MMGTDRLWAKWEDPTEDSARWNHVRGGYGPVYCPHTSTIDLTKFAARTSRTVN